MNAAESPPAGTYVVSPSARKPLPAHKRDPATGRAVIDYRAVATLALPLMLNSSLQAVISLTDTWFVGHISTTAMAGMAAVYWVVLLFLMLVGGVGLAVQTFVAQAEGGRRFTRASHATWVALTASALTLPFFALLAWSGPLLFAPFGLAPDVSAQGMAFWQPRMLGAPLGVGLWAVLGFFNGIARPRVAVMTTGFVAVVNAALNWLFIFKLDGGIAGSAWATNVSMVCGLGFALWVFLGQELRTKYKSHLTWRPDLNSLTRQYRLGLPMGAMYAADLFGMALFQLMQVRLSAVDGAATQIIMMLTSMSYMPGIGIALAGTTLVGQSIGAGDREWAFRLGNAIIWLTVAFMGTLGVLVALSGPWLLPTFMNAADPQSADVVQIGIVLLWIAAGYQIFDGLNLGSGFSLRGAGDVKVPAVLFFVFAWGVFVPLAHSLSFAPGQGWVDFLPQYGYGAAGGWSGLLVYVVLLGVALYLRWRSGRGVRYGYEEVGSIMKLRAFLAVALAVLSVPAVAADPPSRRPISHEDMWLMARVSGPESSPDGRWIVFSVAEPSYDDIARSSDLWIVPSDGSEPPRKLTAGKSGEGDAAWSPDATRIAFTAKREGDDESQVYVLQLANGGDAQRVTNLVGGASAPVWSPDGRKLLVTTRVYAGTASDAENRKVRDEIDARKYNARTYDTFPIRHWDRWLDQRQPTLVVQSLDPGVAPRDLLGGTALRAARGFGGRLGNAGESLDASWTPDGAAVVFAATTERDQAARASVSLALWQVSAEGGEPQRLTGPGRDYSQPSFTPDGRRLLATAEQVSKRWVYNATRLVQWSWPLQGEPAEVIDGFDGSVDEYHVAADSRRVYFQAGQAGHRKLFVASLEHGPTVEVGKLDAGTYDGFSLGGDAATAPVIAAGWGSAVSPTEIGRVDATSGQWRALSNFNAARVAQIDWQPLQEFWFTSKRGRRIRSFVVLPPGFDASHKYPLFVMIHGGPHSMWVDEFGQRWNYHLHARPGYVVLLADYSGSIGYGEAFSRGIQGDPLQGPADEINQAADEAIRRYTFIDGSKQVAGGASYGGHLSNWLAVTTSRYRAIASHAGLYDLKTQWTTSDVVHDRERTLGGPAWESDLAVWRKQSPFYRSPKLATPILLTVGEKDFRVPLNNTLEFWTVLQRQGVPSRLVVFPDENHWVLKGENSRYHYQVIQDWFAKYLQ